MTQKFTESLLLILPRGGCTFKSNSSGNACVELGGNLYTIPHYRVGDIFLSTNSTSPAVRFGGEWEKITGDAYLKIVANGAGAFGGTSSSHVIPLGSMPWHTGHVPEPALPGTGSLQISPSACIKWGNRQLVPYGNDTEAHIITRSAGESYPYYPYYYGIYAWIKRA